MKCLFLGDMSPTAVTSPLFEKRDAAALFNDTVSLFEGNDLNFVNLECALTEHDGAILKFGPALKSPARTAEVLKALGTHVCGLSNNHVFDYGKKGALDTLDALRKNGIEYTGFGENYDDSRKNYVKDGLCIIAVCEHEYSYALPDRMGSRPYDEYDTLADIRAAKAKYDRVVVIYHGGKEFCRYPSPRLLKACRAMADSGADLVLCQHSHCIGCYENYNGTHILYGQGNFHFVKPHDFEGWHTSLAVKYDSVAHGIEFIPMKTETAGISLAKDGEAETIMNAFNARNADLLSGKWRDGWHDFCESMKDKYINVIANACTADATERMNANFAHYLDCEAHTDVWRELLPTYNLTNEK